MKVGIIKQNIVFISIIIMSFLCVLISGVFIVNKFSTEGSSSEVLNNISTEKEINESEDIYFKESITIEINTSLPEIIDYIENPELYNEDKEILITYYLNEEEVTPSITELNSYNVKINYLDNEYNSILNIVDTTKPNVEFKSIAISENAKYDIKDFISSYEDNSGSINYTVYYKDSSNENITTQGTYDIGLTVCDESNNCIDGDTKLIVNKKKVSQSNNNTPNPPQGNKDNVITREEKREILNTIKYNYGVKKITYQNVVYEKNSNGTVKELSRSNKITEMDYSGFNGTIRSMQDEAISVNNSKEVQETKNTILNITNQYRTEVGLHSLKLDDTLSVVATIKAMEMAYSNKFDHERPNGSEWNTLYESYFAMKNITTPHIIGENLAKGFTSDATACQGWRDSPDHYSNMIKPDFYKIGIGKYYFNGTTYWVQVFSS